MELLMQLVRNVNEFYWTSKPQERKSWKISDDSNWLFVYLYIFLQTM